MKQISVIFSVIFSVFMITSAGYALQITESAASGEVDGFDGLIFEAYNDEDPGISTNAGVYSFIIGAADPAGQAWAGGAFAWNAETVSITEKIKHDGFGTPYTVYEVQAPDQEGSPVLFELTDDEWADYSSGYFYWTYQNENLDLGPLGYNQIGYQETLTVYALAGAPASPFAYTDYAVNPDNVTTPYQITGYGDTRSPGPAPVPEPGTLLLFGAGLLGLAAKKKTIKKV